MFRERGEKLQRDWECPIACGSGKTSDSACTKALDAVGRVIRFKGATTCPGYYTRLPEVNRAAEARMWRDKGQLQVLEGDLIPASLVDAIAAIDESMAARMEADRKRMEEKNEKTDE